MIRRNLILDPRATNPLRWRASSGDTIQSVVDEGLPALEMVEQATSGTSVYVDPNTNFYLNPGDQVTFKVQVKAVVPFANFRTRIAAYGGLTSTEGTPNNRTLNPADGWQTFTTTAVVGGTAGGYIRALVWPLDSVPQGSAFRFRRGILEVSTSGDYLDGSMASTPDWTYSWEGEPDASVSVATPTPGLRVEPFLDAPVPRVGITLTGLDAVNPSQVTLYRSSPGGDRRVVRGWRKRLVYGSDYAVDYETPLGRLVTYSLEVNSGAVVPIRVSDTTTLNTPTGYIQDPLLPLGAVPVSGTRDENGPVLQSRAFQELSYLVRSQTVEVLGSREPVALTGKRLAVSGIDFSVFTHAAEEATALRTVLAESELVLVRPLPGWGPLPDLIYTVPSVTERLVDVSWGGSMTRWSLEGDAVRPPSIDVLVALWTYDQVAALWATYDQAQTAATAAAARYLDVQRDPSLGV